MKLDSKYIASAVIIIVAVVKLFGIEIGSEGLTEWITSLIIVVNGVIIAVKAKKEGKLNIFGMAKQ